MRQPRPTELSVGALMTTIYDTLDGLKTVDTKDYTALLVGAEIIREAAGYLVTVAEEHRRAIIAEMAEEIDESG